MIIRRLKVKDSVEAGVNVTGLASNFSKSRRREDGGSFQTKDGPVLELRVGKYRESRSYVPSRGVGWDHPWKTTVEYYTQSSGQLKNSKGAAVAGWGARVKPGFVGGIDPIVLGAPDIDVGEKKGSQNKAKGQGINAQTRKEALLEKPGLADFPLFGPLRTKGYQRTHEIPKQLRDMGAQGVQPDAKTSGGPGNTTITTAGAISGWGEVKRYAARSGIYISVARPSFRMTVSSEGFPFSGSIEYNVAYSSQSLDRDGARAILRTGFPQPPPEPSFGDKLEGVYQDEGYDTFMISVVHFLSPAAGGVEFTSDGKNSEPIVTGDWTPYVQHICFWNLEYQFKTERPKTPPKDAVDPYTSWFVGRFTMAPVAAANAAFSEGNRILAAAWNESQPNGEFWTI